MNSEEFRGRIPTPVCGLARNDGDSALAGAGTGDADCHTSDIGHWFAMSIAGQSETRGNWGKQIAGSVGRLARKDSSKPHRFHGG